MPAEGMTCLTCNANCCCGRIGYSHPCEDEQSLPDDPWSHSHRELIAAGYTEIILPRKGKPCNDLTTDGKCKVHGPNKPRLCASYWCHGKLWKPKKKAKMNVPVSYGSIDQITIPISKSTRQPNLSLDAKYPS